MTQHNKAQARVLGVDYVVLKGRDNREYINGATVRGDNFVHLARLGEVTECGATYDLFMSTYADVEIDCPACIKAIKEK